jgi:hypothetical protein
MNSCTRLPRPYCALWIALFAASYGANATFAQTPATPSPAVQSHAAEIAATLAKTTALRDAFAQRIHATGFTCPIAAPKIVVKDVPSFGQYNDEANTLRTSEWTLLRPQEKAFFMQLAGPGADEARAQEVFERAAHGWIFVHELGHWWQACRGFTDDHSHYQVEYGANRISLAYWRETDPEGATLMMTLFHGVLDRTPSPVPAGETVEAYFDKNYEKLGPSPAYPWFQSHMGVTLEEERPAPKLDEVLAATKK